jgi:hypothetical protein
VAYLKAVALSIKNLFRTADAPTEIRTGHNPGITRPRVNTACY